VNQMQINSKAGVTFDGGLRSILRQGPNVILIGEIRDQETADIALQAAQTGHLLLSTLHTNDAPATITRLSIQVSSRFSWRRRSSAFWRSGSYGDRARRARFQSG